MIKRGLAVDLRLRLRSRCSPDANSASLQIHNAVSRPAVFLLFDVASPHPQPPSPFTSQLPFLQALETDYGNRYTSTILALTSLLPSLLSICRTTPLLPQLSEGKVTRRAGNPREITERRMGEVQ